MVAKRATLVPGEGIRKFLLIDLISHTIPERDRGWFARCQLNHCQAFPFAFYDAVRTGALALLAAGLLPTWGLLTYAAAGLLVCLAQRLLDRRIAVGVGNHERLLRQYCAVAIARGLLWSSTVAVCLAMAPDGTSPVIAACATSVILIDALTLFPMPRHAIAIAAGGTAAIALPLLASGDGNASALAVAALFTLVFTHWAVFNLNYMFATRRLRTRVLVEANETVQLLLNQYDEDGSDWLVECDADGRIRNPSDRFCRAARRERDKLEGLFIADLFLPSSEVERLLSNAFAGAPVRDFVVALEIDGERAWWSLNARPVLDRNGERIGWRGFIADVTKTRVAEEKVTYMAHYDVLTNLPNRSLFNTTLKRAFSRRPSDQPLAVLYIDLDHFKAVNDTYGHALGDQVLAEAAQRIESAIPAGSMVARLGGDEFAVMLENLTDPSQAMAVAEAIAAAMDEPVIVSGQHLPLGASVGVALAPEHGVDGDEVVRAADLALYDAKARGRRGASMFDPALQEQALDRRQLELDLRSAIRRGELALHYQPLVEIDSGQVTGYEALLRWNHSTRGLIEPTSFIRIAEETGQIVQIGEWVLREALMEAATWPKHLSVSVNLSAEQLKDEALMATLIGALAASGVTPNRLELEITETVLMHDSVENLAILHKIRSLGVHIALDDFGTGYSSLNYLRSFPFDKIKIDRCFINGLDERPDNQAIIQAVVSLAGKLNIRTTAEGVESAEQLARLRADGCQQVQGFLFSRAVPASELKHEYERPDRISKGRQAISLDDRRKSRPDRAAAAGKNRKAG